MVFVYFAVQTGLIMEGDEVITAFQKLLKEETAQASSVLAVLRYHIGVQQPAQGCVWCGSVCVCPTSVQICS